MPFSNIRSTITSISKLICFKLSSTSKIHKKTLFSKTQTFLDKKFSSQLFFLSVSIPFDLLHSNCILLLPHGAALSREQSMARLFWWLCRTATDAPPHYFLVDGYFFMGFFIFLRKIGKIKNIEINFEKSWKIWKNIWILCSNN
jgi:hypothetical protein